MSFDMTDFSENKPASRSFRVIILSVSAALLFTLLLLTPAPGMAGGAVLSGVYSGQGMILQLLEKKGDGEVEGVIYRKNLSVRFRGTRKGEIVGVSSLFVRNDRRAPYRKATGSMTIRVRDRGERLRLEIGTAEMSLSGLFRRSVGPRAYNLLSLYGDTYCDGRHLVLVVEDSAPPAEKGWLSRLLQKKDEALPVVGMYFGPDIWYSFQAAGGLYEGFKNPEVISGGGVYGDYLGSVSVSAGIEDGRLRYGFQYTGGGRSLILPLPSQKVSCTQVVTKWTSKRRMQRGRRLSAPETVKKAPAEKRKKPARPSKDDKTSTVRKEKPVVEPPKAQDIPEASRVGEKKERKNSGKRKIPEPGKGYEEKPAERGDEDLPVEEEYLEPLPGDDQEFFTDDEAGLDESWLEEPQYEDLPESFEEDRAVYDDTDAALEPYEGAEGEDLQVPDESGLQYPDAEVQEAPQEYQ